MQIDGVSDVAKAYRLPYSPPAWLTPQRTVIGALLWSHAVGLVMRITDRAALSEPILNLAVRVPVALWLVNAKTWRAAFGRSLVASLLISLSPLRHAANLPHSLIRPVAWAVGEVVGALALVLAVAAWHTLLLTRTLPFRSKGPAHDAVDRTVRATALWLMPSGLFAAVVIVVSRVKHVGTIRFAWLSVLLTLIVPGLIAGFATARIAERHNWLRRVGEGREPKWRVVTSNETSGLPFVETSSNTETCRVLVRVDDPEDPYREVTREIPVASLADLP